MWKGLGIQSFTLFPSCVHARVFLSGLHRQPSKRHRTTRGLLHRSSSPPSPRLREKEREAYKWVLACPRNALPNEEFLLSLSVFLQASHSSSVYTEKLPSLHGKPFLGLYSEKQTPRPDFASPVPRRSDCFLTAFLLRLRCRSLPLPVEQCRVRAYKSARKQRKAEKKDGPRGQGANDGKRLGEREKREEKQKDSLVGSVRDGSWISFCAANTTPSFKTYNKQASLPSGEEHQKEKTFPETHVYNANWRKTKPSRREAEAVCLSHLIHLEASPGRRRATDRPPCVPRGEDSPLGGGTGGSKKGRERPLPEERKSKRKKESRNFCLREGKDFDSFFPPVAVWSSKREERKNYFDSSRRG